jgi:hypothetical protein
MTTQQQPTEVNSTFEEVTPAASTTERQAGASEASTTRERPSTTPREATDPNPELSISATDEGRHAEMDSSLSSSTRTAEAHPSSAGTASSAANTESTAETADTSRSGAESSPERSLFADDEFARLRARWADVQAAFVDDPRDCVQKADGLVADVVKQLAIGFTHARTRLEEQWSRGEEASTEDLRVALTRYREFFERLLAV